MQCPEVQRKLSAYIDGELDSKSVQSLVHHIGQCGTCREMAVDFRNVDSLVRGLPKVDMAPDSLGQLLGIAQEPRAATTEKASGRSPFSAVIRLVSSLVDLLETRTSSTHTLDEFDDFPPFSLGSIYFKMWDQPGRG